MTEIATDGEIVRDLAERGAYIRPRDFTDLFYGRLLPDGRCPVVGGRRLIPRDLVPLIEATLRKRGRI